MGVEKEYQDCKDESLLQLKKAVQEFFGFLNRTEESESGRVFHPVDISCCRALWLEPLEDCLDRMRKYSNAPRT